MTDSSADRLDNWLTAAVAGDAEALEQLLFAYYDQLLARIDRKMSMALRRQASPEDILQQAFTEVFQRIQTFAPSGQAAFYTWIAAIADHRLIDNERAIQAAKRGHGKVHHSLNFEDSVCSLIDLLGDTTGTPSRFAANDERVAAFYDGLAALDEESRQLIELRFLQGLPVNEVAELLNRKPRTIRENCNRALDRLRAHLGHSSQFFSHK